MVGSYGYASQELVNLLLTGRATSNTFDGEVVFEESGSRVALAGVVSRPACGFLSANAAGGNDSLGRHFREPAAPCWVVFAESHYSVLFAAPKLCAWPGGAAAGRKPRPTYGRKTKGPSYGPDPSRCLGLEATASAARGRPLDVVYWDGLGRQDELYRLTVLPAGPSYAGPQTARAVDISSLGMWAWVGWGAGSGLAWNDVEEWEPLAIR